MWAQGEWAESGDTAEGHRFHARVDKPNAPLPSPQALESEERRRATRSSADR
jgi:CRISPR-associated exonuclease Cas4/CRISPR-associated protein Cas1